MDTSNQNHETPDKSLAAVCGLFCPTCTLYIAMREDPERLKTLADQFNLSEETVKCDGCHSDKRGPYCRNCNIVTCAAEKGVDFCGECVEYPCEELKAFQGAMPHRIEILKAQERLKEVGYEKWFKEMIEDYSCPQCRTINSAYDLTCRKCGNDPSCEYVKRHKQVIEEHSVEQR